MSSPTLDPRAPSAPSRPRPSSLQAHARAAIPPLCAALGLDAQASGALDASAALTDAWGARSAVDGMAARRGAAPYAIVLAFGEHDSELRLVVETPGEEAGSGALAGASRALTRRLAERYALSIAAVARIEDLFEPTAGTPAPGAHAAWFRDGAATRFEVLFDARAQGRWRARALVEEALVRLGLGRAWPEVAERVLQRGLYDDDLAYLSIPLPGLVEGRGEDTPRVDLYVRHFRATVADVRAALGPSPLEGRAEELCVALTGSASGYGSRPLVTRHAIGEDARVVSTALYVPVAEHARNDAVVRGRVSAYLAHLGLAAEPYERALGSFAGRPLTTGPGLQEHVGLRSEARGLVLSVELAPELQGSRRVDDSPEPPRLSTEDIVRRFEHDIVLADHPFLRRLARDPVHLGPLWLMIANFWEGIVHDFPKRVARVIAAIDDDRIRCVLAKQLNDELGEGDYARAHKPMFRTLLDALAPHRMAGPDDVLLAPGRAFGRELGAMMFSDDPYEAVGAMMMIEIYGKQTDLFMGAQFRRQDVLDPAALLWLHLHEGLEVEHAEESFILARCVPDDPAAIAAAWRGAEAIVTAGRHYFDAFYRICFA